MKIEINRIGSPSVTLEHESDAEKYYLISLVNKLQDEGVDLIIHHPHYAPFHGSFSGFTLNLKTKQA